MRDYTAELNIAKRAARSAAEIIQKFQRESNFTVDFKGKNDLVTEADVRAEEEILTCLQKEYPNDQVLAEETTEDITLSEDRTWLIDPIDGTTNFTHGFPIYCVSIGLWEDYQPKMGLVLEVTRSEYFTALAGKGAFRNGDPISVSKNDAPQDALIGTGFPYNDLSLVDHYIDFFRMLMSDTQGVRRPGAASFDLCCLACGRFDGFFEYSLSPWDVGAAALIVQEAGGIVTDWSGSDDWLFGERIVAGNPAIHKFLLDGIKERFTDEERNDRRQT